MTLDTRSPAWRGLRTENVSDVGFVPANDTEFQPTDNDGLLIAAHFERTLNNDHEMRKHLVFNGQAITVHVSLTQFAVNMRSRTFLAKVPNLGNKRWGTKVLDQMKWLIKQSRGNLKKAIITDETIELPFTYVE